MRIGSEYQTSNTQIAYPFFEHSPGLARDGNVVHGSFATAPLDLFTDALITAPDRVERVYLANIAENGPPVYFLFFTDQLGNAVVWGNVDISAFDPTKYYQVIELEVPGGISAKLVVPTRTFSDYCNAYFGDNMFQFRLPLAAHTLNTLEKKIQSLELYEELPDPPEPYTPGPITGDVLLINGYNIDQFITTEAEEDDTTNITLSAVPGAGAGLAPCQHEESELFRGLMRLKPDASGNMQITGGPDGCYAIIPHPDTGIFEIHGTCTACCSCEDYENTAKALQVLLQRSKDILDTLWDGHQDYYEPGVTHFNTVVAPKFIGPVWQMNGSGGAAWGGDPTIRSGAANWVTLIGKMQNRTAYNIQPQQFSLSLSTPAGYTIRQILWEYDGQGDQITTPLDLAGDGVPVIPKGKTFVIYVLAYTDFPDDPVWTGTATLRVQIQSPTPTTPDLTDSFTVD